MKRVVLVPSLLVLALGVGFGTSWVATDEADETSTVDVFPRSLAPLRVPEVRLPGDPLPTTQPTGPRRPGELPDGFRVCRPQDLEGDGSSTAAPPRVICSQDLPD